MRDQVNRAAVLRRTLFALGFDPDTHTLEPRRPGIKSPFAGVLVRDSDGKPVRFVTDRQLKAMVTGDAEFQARWEGKNGVPDRSA